MVDASVLLRIQNNLCFFCKEPIPENEVSRDHLVPRSLGGSNNKSNLVVTCKTANELFGSMSLKDKLSVVISNADKGAMRCPIKDKPGIGHCRNIVVLVMKFLTSYSEVNRPQTRKKLTRVIRELDVNSECIPAWIIKELEKIDVLTIIDKQVIYHKVNFINKIKEYKELTSPK